MIIQIAIIAALRRRFHGIATLVYALSHRRRADFVRVFAVRALYTLFLRRLVLKLRRFTKSTVVSAF